MKLSYIPNIITFARIALLVPFMGCLHSAQYSAAFYIFFFAGLSDGLDGWLARRYHWQTQLGGMLDPISDKLFVSCSYLSLGWLAQLPWWLVFLVLTRDVIIVGGVGIYRLIYGPVNFHSTMLSKTNTVLQGFVVFAALFQMAFVPLPSWLFYGLIYITMLTTTFSCLHYVYIGISMAWQHAPSNKT